MKERLRVAAIITLIIFTLTSSVVFARSSSDIQKDIDKQQQELQQTEDDLNAAKNNLDYYNGALSQASGGVPQLEAQIKQIEAQIEYNQKQLDLLKQSKDLKELEKAQKEAERQESLKSNYMTWRSRSIGFVQFLNDEYDFKKNEQYSDLILNRQQNNIMGLNSELTVINADIDQYATKKADLEKSNTDLQKQKQDLENQIAYYNSQINYNSSSISNLENNINSIQKTISLLSGEQKDAYLKEAELAQQAGNGGQSIGGCVTSDDGNNDNNIQFCGVGNDFVQGHGVGMSQWGANGMALKGFSANEITQFYYTGVQVATGYQNRTVNVEGYGTINVEDYVAGQGEVPGRACGTQQQANQNPSKYVVDNPNSSWDCWPEEAIKAQAIAFRTYGLYYAGFLHADARSQVYNGSHYSQWAADETKGKVLTSGGQIIEALYSADNNQGFGTANNETIFQDFAGNGTAISYLRSVNDNAMATYTSYTNWGYRSNTYTMNDIYNMMNWTISNDGGGFASFLQGIKNQLGAKPTKISFIRDPSLRVAKVKLQTQSGNSAIIGAWWFTYMYNVYNSSHNVKTPEGNKDWLWSQTFFVHVK